MGLELRAPEGRNGSLNDYVYFYFYVYFYVYVYVSILNSLRPQRAAVVIRAYKVV